MKLTSDAVEKWAAKVMNHCHTELTHEQAETMVGLFLNAHEIDKDEELKKKCEDPKEGGILSMIVNRCKSCGFEITRSAVLFLSMFVDRPGNVTMAVAYIRYRLRDAYSNNKVDIGFLSTRCFPMGVPSEKDWQELWEEQKLDFNELKIQRKIHKFAPDNVLDYRSAYQSIM